MALLASACAPNLVDVDLRAPAFLGSDAGRSIEARCDPKARNVLLLSSGGADGAFGAGVLTGWRRSGRRPIFDVVTGSSVGALQATLLFAGGNDDNRMETFFTTTSTRQLMGGSRLTFLFKPGVRSLAPLRRTLQNVVTDNLLDRIAAEHARGRRLHVATTDLTYGRLVSWDMGAIAQGSDVGRRERFVAVLLASIAVPGLFDPVILRDQEGQAARHGDGAVKAPLLFDRDMLGDSCPGSASVWAVINGHLSPAAATVSDTRLALGNGRRAVALLFRRLMWTTTSFARTETEQLGATFRIVALPTDIAEAEDPLNFRPAEMRKLFQHGTRLGVLLSAQAGEPSLTNSSDRS